MEAYRFISNEEPTDEQLEQLMEAALITVLEANTRIEKASKQRQLQYFLNLEILYADKINKYARKA
jgi:hypothetical protein